MSPSISSFSSPKSSIRTRSPSRRCSLTTPASSISTAMTEPREAPVRRQTSLTTCRVSTVRSCTATAFHRPKFFSVGLFSFTILYFIFRSPF
ncbi:MAG: hypothetical protein J5506_05880 [Prevotella sp.]|nr:hypothetical protein [Prevotella sp.]